MRRVQASIFISMPIIFLLFIGSLFIPEPTATGHIRATTVLQQQHKEGETTAVGVSELHCLKGWGGGRK